jgi:hypothetical protein
MPLAFAPAGAAIAAAVFVVLAWLLWPLLRRDELARFFAVGMLAAAAPFGATVAQDRLALPLGLGAFGLIARLIAAVRDGSLADARSRWSRRILIALHAVLAPLLFVPSLWFPWLFDREARRLADAAPGAPVVAVLNSPTELLYVFPEAIRRGAGQRWPDHVYPLYAGDVDVRVERVAANAVEIAPAGGWLHGPLELVMRRRDSPFRVGHRVQLDEMSVEVLEVNARGRPARARFTFARDLSQVGWVA